MYMSTLVNNLVQFHNVRMPKIGQRVDLTMDCLLCLSILQVFLFVRLYSDHVLWLSMRGSFDDGKGSLSDLESDLKLFQI